MPKNQNQPVISSRRSTIALVSLIMAHGAAVQAQNSVTNTPPTVNVSTNTAAKLPDVVVQGQQEPIFKVDRASSPKFTEPLLDTPQTIVVVPKDVYTQQGATTLSEVMRNTPGITFAAGEGGSVASGDSFFMRGYDISGNIFVDGVRDSGAYSRDVYNLEQVEVAKGPAGADSGRGGSSGYVNLVTKTPNLVAAYSGIGSYGSADQKRITGDLNQPLKITEEEGGWLNATALRLNGMWQDGGVPGRDYVHNNAWAIAPSLAFGLGTPTRVIVAATYTQLDNLPDSGLPVVALPGGSGTPTTPPTGPVDQSNYYGLPDEDFDHVDSGSFTARIEHDFNSETTLRNQFRYAKTTRDALNTYIQNSAAANYNPVTGVVTPRRIRNPNDNEILSDQLNVTTHFNTGFIEHDFSSGLEFTREEQFTPTWTGLPGPSTSIYNPDPFRPVTAAQIPYQTNNAYASGKIDTVALYAFDTLKLNKYFQINGSVRGEYYQVDSNTRTTAGVDTVPLETSDNLLSWKAGIVFKPRENGSIYAAYGDSFTPPGTAFTLSTNANSANNPLFEPQESRNIEVGTKWDFFSGRLSTSLALYHSENLNVVTLDNTTGQYVQDAGQTVKGVEFGISGKITEEWFVFGGFGWMDSEYTAPATTSGGINDGAVLRFTPRMSGSLWTAYRLPFGLTLGGGVQYSDSVVRSTATTVAPSSTSLPSAPSYWLLNAMISYEVTKHCTVRLNINNITDEDDSFRLNNNGGRYYPAIPRSFILAAEMYF